MSSPKYAILPHRAVLSVSGEDAVAFLQGLVSNDVERVSDDQTIWAAFLTPQGKFLHEFMIASWNGELLLDCEAERAEDLRTRLRRFRLRAKVEVTSMPSQAVAAVWGDTCHTVFGLGDQAGVSAQSDGDVAFNDPRLSAAGVRYIGSADTIAPTLEARGCSAGDIEEYESLRISLGLPDGSRDMGIEKALLLENGFEELGGVDFKKGCYIGQELTARTHYRALIKKRLLPIEIDGAAPQPGTPITLDGKDAGEMKSSSGHLGLALIRLATWNTSPDGWLSAGAAKVKPVPSDWTVLPGAKDL